MSRDLSIKSGERVVLSPGGVTKKRKVLSIIFKIAETDDRMAHFRLFGPPDVGKLKAKGNIEGLIKALGDRDEEVRKNAVDALGEIGMPAVNPLIKALGDRDEEVCKNAVGALGEIGIPAVDPLIKALGDEEWRVRILAVKSDDEKLAAILDEEWRVRRGAAEALGEIGDTRAVDPLIKALGDEEWFVIRRQAAKALGKIGDARAVDPMMKALGDVLEVRSIAAVALAHIYHSGKLDQQSKEKIREAITECGIAFTSAEDVAASELRNDFSS